jgi:hypothetical protein
MNKILSLAGLIFTCTSLQAQVYTDSVSFKNDLWTILTAEEYQIAPDSIHGVWVKRQVKRKENVVYIDVTRESTMIGIKWPEKIRLVSAGLTEGGFRKEQWYGPNCMYMQTLARDERGALWEVTVGRDRYSHDLEPDPTGAGRIFLTLQPVEHNRSGYYFTLGILGDVKVK